MATTAGPSPLRHPLAAPRRAIEWGMVGLLVLVLTVAFLQWGRRVQGQAELAAVQSTLGALRSAAVVDDLRRKASGAGAPAVGNPFDLLRAPPANYLGRLEAEQVSGAVPGHWWFEPGCNCVTYLPQDPDWLVSPSGAATLRFQVQVRRGPMELQPLETYLWQGMSVH